MVWSVAWRYERQSWQYEFSLSDRNVPDRERGSHPSDVAVSALNKKNARLSDALCGIDNFSVRPSLERVTQIPATSAATA